MNKLFLCKVSRECPHCGRDPLEGEIEFVVANNLKEVKEVLDENYDIYSDDFYYDPIIINRFDQIDKDYYSYEVFVPKNDKKHLFYYDEVVQENPRLQSWDELNHTIIK